ncbi:flagellar protein FlbB [Bradyrhizobium sp. LHD-71]|uniref:MotE family protein n=1 Tax=Bradyrhizobium sp. LHD-71 TaxID=3072141 RepID=UPI00280F6E99|nr:flagellar protein FlbB [Bradyrhizobium sp. LHD-71]MDQ8732621.1 flagellar protein FlbB [Bradyrhizobium sp. LHD-71]
MKRRRDFRLIPILLIAIACLSVLKIAGLLLDGGYVLVDEGRRQQLPQKLSWAQETLNYPVPGGKVETIEVTGSVDAPKKDAPAQDPAKGSSEARPTEAVVPGQMSPTERAVLERLQERRQELEARAREVDIRESLLKAAEKRIGEKVDEMKGVETRISAAAQQKEEADNARFKGIVTMYENMKPKDAGRIFDRLDMSVLIEVASRMKPQKMSDILAQMSPEAAEKLTVELARRSGGIGMSASMSSLPKIEGRPANGAP